MCKGFCPWNWADFSFRFKTRTVASTNHNSLQINWDITLILVLKKKALVSLSHARDKGFRKPSEWSVWSIVLTTQINLKELQVGLEKKTCQFLQKQTDQILSEKEELHLGQTSSCTIRAGFGCSFIDGGSRTDLSCCIAQSFCPILRSSFVCHLHNKQASGTPVLIEQMHLPQSPRTSLLHYSWQYCTRFRTPRWRPMD